MLCVPCSTLDIEKLSSGEEIRHYLSYGDLVASSQNECGLCALLMKHGFTLVIGLIGNDEVLIKARSQDFEGGVSRIRSLQFYTRTTSSIEIGILHHARLVKLLSVGC
jgi:hypothetical protein